MDPLPREAKGGPFQCYITFVYASNMGNDRSQAWDELQLMRQTINYPWILLGDFNVVASIDEKILEEGEVVGVSEELPRFCEEAALDDLKWYVKKYTWTNWHTSCKLDRALVNEAWHEEHPDSYAMIIAL